MPCHYYLTCFDKLCSHSGLQGVSQVANIAMTQMIRVDYGRRGTQEFSLVFKRRVV